VSTSRGALPRVSDAQHSHGTLAPIVLSLCSGAAQIVTFPSAVEAHPPSGVLADAAERAWHQAPKGAA
jgi:hypothetical protein